MKLKYIFIGILFLNILAACQPEEYEMFDNTLTSEDIIKLEIRADHKTLMPDGQAEMKFHSIAYANKEVL